MTHEHVETFLAVVANGNITAAANQLFVSQSTVSTRIQQLEEELGAMLILRQKGHRNIELTTFGNAFVPLAGQWESIWQDAQQLRTLSDIRTLTIASIDSVNNYTFVPFFQRLIRTRPSLKLNIRTHHSNEIHSLIESRAADIGYVFSRTSYPDIISRPVYRELMYLVCHRDSPYDSKIPCGELDPALEVFLRWGPDYQNWHDQHWSPDRHALISVNTGSTLQRFLNEPGRWAIAPMSVIHEMSHDSNLVHYALREPPPPRICYELTNRHQSAYRQELIDLFREEFESFLSSDEDICRFEPWMLGDDT